MRRIAGVVALLTGAVLAVAGSLRPLYEQEWVYSDLRSRYRMTLWASEYTTPSGGVGYSPKPVLYGVPVVVAAALLVVAAVLLLVPARPLVQVAVRVGAVVATTLLIGSVWTVGHIVLEVVTRENDIPIRIDSWVGLGFWVLVAACVTAAAGALLVQQRQAPEPATVYQFPGDDDTDTPPMGVPIHPPVSTEESPPG
jgi:hypothetical protein